jgi:hypothetical protein
MIHNTVSLLPVFLALALGLIRASPTAAAGEPHTLAIDDMDVCADDVLLSCPHVADVQVPDVRAEL